MKQVLCYWIFFTGDAHGAPCQNAFEKSKMQYQPGFYYHEMLSSHELLYGAIIHMIEPKPCWDGKCAATHKYVKIAPLV